MSGLCGDCGATSGCGCVVGNGTGTTVSGTGAVGSPYAVNLTAQPITWLTDIAIASPANTQALIYDSATSKWKNKSIGGFSAQSSLSVVPPAISSTSLVFTYSAYTSLVTITNTSGKSVTGSVLVLGNVQGGETVGQGAILGFQLELNGVAQTEVGVASTMLGMTPTTASTQFNLAVGKNYPVTVAAGGTLTFRVRSAGTANYSGGATSGVNFTNCDVTATAILA